MSRAIKAAMLFGVALAASIQTAVAAEQIVPSRVSYQTKILEDAGARVCELTLTATKPPNPETVLASAIVGLDKSRKAVVAGFSLTVFDDQPPFASIARVGFSSAGFSSDGMEQVADPDNSVWVWMNASNTVEFLTAFMAGDFRLSFARTGSAGLRTYQIADAPAADLRDRFVKCATGLAPGEQGAAKAPAVAALEAIARAQATTTAGPDAIRAATARVMRSAPVAISR